MKHVRAIGLALGFLAVGGAAQANALIPFQARLVDGAGTPLNGVYDITFSIYDTPTGGTSLNGWFERHPDPSRVLWKMKMA